MKDANRNGLELEGDTERWMKTREVNYTSQYNTSIVEPGFKKQLRVDFYVVPNALDPFYIHCKTQDVNGSVEEKMGNLMHDCIPILDHPSVIIVSGEQCDRLLGYIEEVQDRCGSKFRAAFTRDNMSANLKRLIFTGGELVPFKKLKKPDEQMPMDWG